MRYNFIKFNILCLFSFLFVCILFLGCPDQESSSSGGSGGGSSGGSSSESSDDSDDSDDTDDTIETSFKKIVDSSTGYVGEYTSIAVDGSNVYISYYDVTNLDLKFAKSTDRGNTWDPGNIKTVDSTDTTGLYTSIAVDGSNVYISYCNYMHGNLKFAKSTDGGNTWGLTTVDDSTGTGYTSIAVDGLNVYISYYDDINYNLKFAKSTDGGETWDAASNIKTVDSEGYVGEYTSIAVEGSNVYISYYDDNTNDDLKFAKSTNSEDDWDADNIKTVDFAEDVGWDTSIAVDGSNIYISYYDITNDNLKFAKSTDGGNTWDAANIKTVDSGGAGRYTSIAVDGSNIYISYCYFALGDLKFARSTDGGNTWDAANIKTVDSTGNVGRYTSIAVNGSNVYISYYDYTNGYLKFARSVDRGNTW